MNYIYKPPPPPPPEGSFPYKKRKHEEPDEPVAPTFSIEIKDVAAWIEERRRRWPTNKRIAEKRAQEEEELRKKALHSISHGPRPDQSKEKKPNVCKYFAKGRCHHGDQCKYSHDVAEPVRREKEIKYRRFDKPEKTSLYLRMVQTDYDRAHEPVLGFIAFLKEKGVL